jgi:hypothetical protein
MKIYQWILITIAIIFAGVGGYYIKAQRPNTETIYLDIKKRNA